MILTVTVILPVKGSGIVLFVKVNGLVHMSEFLTSKW